MDVVRCPNCKSEVAGRYCQACGQRRMDPRDLSARYFLDQFVDELADVRSRFKTLRTLRGLFTPGLLTVEYLEGRREPYLSPLKVYFVCAALFFVAAPVAGFTLASFIGQDANGAFGAQVAARMAARGMERGLYEARFDVRIQSVYTVALGLGVLITALFQQWVRRRQAWPYGAHLVFSLHCLSFQYIVTAAVGIGREHGLSDEMASLIGLALIAVYLGLALRRVYPASIFRTVVNTATLLALTLFWNYVASATAIALTLTLV